MGSNGNRHISPGAEWHRGSFNYYDTCGVAKSKIDRGSDMDKSG